VVQNYLHFALKFVSGFRKGFEARHKLSVLEAEEDKCSWNKESEICCPVALELCNIYKSACFKPCLDFFIQTELIIASNV